MTDSRNNPDDVSLSENKGNHSSELKNIIEAAIFAASEPIGVRKLQAIFMDGAQPDKDEIDVIVNQLESEYEHSGLELVRIGAGWRFQTKEKYSSWMRRLSADKAPRYSRAQLETLAIIAYRQPVTRGDIEEVRGVSVSTDIIRILEERGWIREIGHRDVPGRPALFGTTQEFLSYFNLRSLKELPELIGKRKFEEIAQEMHMQLPLEIIEENAAATLAENDGPELNSADVIPLRQESPSKSEEDDVVETENEIEVETESEIEGEIEIETEGEAEDVVAVEAKVDLNNTIDDDISHQINEQDDSEQT